MRGSGRSAIVAVASREPARATAYAAEWGIPHTGSYDELLSRLDVDIVYVPLPNSLHAGWTIRALEAGKHVLCEKPLALTPRDVDRIADVAARQRRVAAEGFMYLHHAQTARLAALVHDGTIGTLRTIASAFTFVLTRDPDVRRDPALGGGSLWDVGCYPVSLGQWLAAAPPVRVMGIDRRGPSGVDEAFAATIEYANGVTCQFQCGFQAAYQSFVRVVGSDGVLLVERPFRPEGQPIVLQRDGRTEEIAVPGSPIFADEVADMEDAVLGLRPPRLTLAASRMHVATIAALYAAARDGRPASLPAQ